MQIDSDGQVTTPLQPMFFAQRSTYVANVTGDGKVYTVTFDSEIGDIGSNFNTSTHQFTSPIAGSVYYTNLTLPKI